MRSQCRNPSLDIWASMAGAQRGPPFNYGISSGKPTLDKERVCPHNERRPCKMKGPAHTMSNGRIIRIRGTSRRLVFRTYPGYCPSPEFIGWVEQCPLIDLWNEKLEDSAVLQESSTKMDWLASIEGPIAGLRSDPFFPIRLYFAIMVSKYAENSIDLDRK